MEEINRMIAETGTVTIPTAEYWNLLRAQRDLEILHKAYNGTKYGTLDAEVAEAVFGPKVRPEPKPEPAPDPTVLLAKVTDMTEKAQRLLEEVQTERKAAAATAANIHSIPASSGVSASEVGAIRFKEGT